MSEKNTDSVVDYASRPREGGMARFIVETSVGMGGYLALGAVIIFGFGHWPNQMGFTSWAILTFGLLGPMLVMLPLALFLKSRDMMIGTFMIFGLIAVVVFPLAAMAGSQ